MLFDFCVIGRDFSSESASGEDGLLCTWLMAKGVLFYVNTKVISNTKVQFDMFIYCRDNAAKDGASLCFQLFFCCNPPFCVKLESKNRMRISRDCCIVYNNVFKFLFKQLASCSIATSFPLER